MICYIKKFNENKNKNKNTITMSLKVNNDKNLFKNYSKIWKKVEKLMGIDFNTKPTYGDDDEKIYKNNNKNIWRQYNYKFL